MFSINSLVLSAETVSAAPATPVKKERAKAERQDVMVVDAATGALLGKLSTHLEKIGLSASVYHTRLRSAKEEQGEKFVSPYTPCALVPGFVQISSDSDFFAEADGGGREGKFVCIFKDGLVKEVAESDLADAKKENGFVGCVRVSGRWCLETEKMSDKYPRPAKADDATVAETAKAS